MSHLHPKDTSDTTPLLRHISTSSGYDATLNEVEVGCDICQCCNGHDDEDVHALPPKMPRLPTKPQFESERAWIPEPEAVWSDPKHPEDTVRPRTLVLCFDGTGDQFDNDVSGRRVMAMFYSQKCRTPT